ncbi:transporter substrate-binding domain-containing protein [Bosea sp. (in: a-proteobacteria)]|uniref:transporter substrate-binding domain-containing protein n=1 Tax=Bosea sp. (in: a-proteobacteria) TaxID=1871050 RepID=UPI00260F96B8|nr:transporter substrate-binding domain-containing protein [Bosea sp. (in: a-proteobacteria)]MCO5093377.1 transporter substrate-binding domain-containing protein [Bosea sp. (in: a-proteobacteria)]
MKRILNWASAALATLCLTLTTAAGAQTVDDIIKRGTVQIAVDPTSAPFGITGSDGQPDGFDVDVARLVAKYLGVKLELVPVTSQNRIPYLLTNRVDMVISLFSVTPERALQVQFSSPYAAVGTIVTARADRKIASFADLKGLKVGVPRGTIPDNLLTKMALPDVQIVRFDDEATSIQALVSGQVDALGSSTTALLVLNRGKAQKEFERKLTLVENHFGIGIRRGQSDLLQWLNTFVYAIRANGELNALTEKWTGEKMGALPNI